MSGAATGGILAARAGPRAMASAAVVGGVILALIEGMGIWMNNYFSMPPPGMEGECIYVLRLGMHLGSYCQLQKTRGHSLSIWPYLPSPLPLRSFCRGSSFFHVIALSSFPIYRIYSFRTKKT